MRSLILHATEIRHLLDSGECEVRRAVKTDFNITDDGLWMRNGTAFLRRVNGLVFTDDQLMRAMAGLFCPLGVPGEKRWVRETWADVNTEEGPAICYKANRCARTWREFSTTFGPDYGAGPSMDYRSYPGNYTMWWSDLLRGEPGHGWRSSATMPRWASRITLEIVRTWVERVQNISREDAMAYAKQWNRANLRNPFASNPWTWAAEIRKVES